MRSKPDLTEGPYFVTSTKYTVSLEGELQGAGSEPEAELYSQVKVDSSGSLCALVPGPAALGVPGS